MKKETYALFVSTNNPFKGFKVIENILKEHGNGIAYTHEWLSPLKTNNMGNSYEITLITDWITFQEIREHFASLGMLVTVSKNFFKTL